MKNLRTLVAGWRARYFPSEDDRAWNMWVDHKRRETKDLIALLGADVRESLKRRALFLLLVPSSDHNPIYWTEKVGGFHHGIGFLSALSASLRSYAVEVVSEFYATLKPEHRPVPQRHVAGGGGFTVVMDVQDKFHSALCFYNKCILALLSRVTEPEAECLFALFSLNDISVFWNMDFCSGYNPFASLLDAKDIDEKWKRCADERMRRIIEAEVSGEVKPRADYEVAWRCYVQIIRAQLCGAQISYSIELLASQLRFIMANRQYGSGSVIEGWQVARIFQLLMGDQYKEFRREIARYVVLEDRGDFSSFSVCNEETSQAAALMMEEFGASDPDLAKRIKLLIEQNRQRNQEIAEREAQQRQSDDELLAKMK